MHVLTHRLKVVGLLLGFYLICFGLVAGLLVADVLVSIGVEHALALLKLALFLYLATIAAIIIMIRGVFVSIRMRKPPGVAVTPAQEPALWRRVTELAAMVGTKPPAEIRLVPQLNAAVWEDTKLLGLIPGKRHMMIGVPLLLGLTRPQLDAIIAHELGHFSGSHTRSGALDARVRASIVTAAQAAIGGRRNGKPRRFWLLGNDVFAALFTAYARLVLSVTNEESRKQEYAADRTAAQISGRRAAASALREMPALDVAYDFYLDRYVTAGLPLNLLPLPMDIMSGFAMLLREPDRRKELDEIRTNPPATKPSPYDSHPPLADRIAAIENLPDDGRPDPDPRDRAIGLLANPAAAMSEVGVRMVAAQGVNGTGVDWDRLAHAVACQRMTAQALPLRELSSRFAGRQAALADFLGLVDAGRMDAVLDSMPKPESVARINATGRAARELVKNELQAQLYAWVLADLAAAGRVTWRHSWAQVNGEMVMAPELERDLDAAMRAIVAVIPDPRPLRAVLSRIGATV
jgi:Zn-dependent protease with chaperone function